MESALLHHVLCVGILVNGSVGLGPVFITDGKTLNKKVIQDEILRLEIKEANKVAKRNSDAVLNAARGHGPPAPIGVSPRNGSGFTSRSKAEPLNSSATVPFVPPLFIPSSDLNASAPIAITPKSIAVAPDSSSAHWSPPKGSLKCNLRGMRTNRGLRD